MGGIFQTVNESLEMLQVARHFGYESNRSGFIHSPFKEERTASCKMYPHSFCDFSTNTGGDCIKFTSMVLGVNNWEACQYLVQAFSLPISLSGGTDRREEIERQQRERQRQEERKQEFRVALLGEIDSLKRWADIYRTAIDKQLYEPFSDMWGYCINELQKAEYKLDILCAADQGAYRRMKTNAVAGLPSDYQRWLLDMRAILAEDGAFQASQSELTEIQVQRVSEPNRRPEYGRGNMQQEKRGEFRRKQKKQTRSERWTELSQILNFQ